MFFIKRKEIKRRDVEMKKIVEWVRSLFKKEETVVTAESPVIELSMAELPIEEIKTERQLVEVLSKVTERIPNSNQLLHTVIVKLSEGDWIKPNKIVGDTAIEIGYHPNGYWCFNEELIELGDGTFQVKWNSYNSCD